MTDKQTAKHTICTSRQADSQTDGRAKCDIVKRMVIPTCWSFVFAFAFAFVFPLHPCCIYHTCVGR
jgi:hypothetical protein